MKVIENLQESEILELTNEEILNIIKFKKAEAGIKIISEPLHPDYVLIPDADKEVFQIQLFGDSISFSGLSEITKIVEIIKNSDSANRIQYGVDSTYYLKNDLSLYSTPWDQISTKKVYSESTYEKLKDSISTNKKLKEEYESEMKNYTSIQEESKEIESEVYAIISYVRKKYSELESFCYKFKFDYMPLSDNNEEIAMNFLNKAYTLSEEQKQYVIAHYND